MIMVNRGVPARPGTKPLHSSDVDVAELKRLVEIQTQIVKHAEQIKMAKKHRRAGQRKLTGMPRRFVSFISQLW